jgi:glucose/arabinose dehydrogenase
MRAAVRGASAFALVSILMLSGCDRGVSAFAPQQAGASGAVRQGPPNKRDAVPAFPEQTRAPEQRSAFSVKAEVFARDIPVPWAMARLPNGSLLVTSRPGKLFLVKPDGSKTEVAGAPAVSARGQGGLLDVSLAPDFATSRAVYLSFSEPREGNTNSTSLFGAQLSADGSRLENGRVIFRQNPAWASAQHFGSNIEWDREGNLFLTVGERSQPEPRVLAQDLRAGMGKVFHLTPDGQPAPGNPFIGRNDAQPEIWSYGHRNVQGAAINPDTGQLWTIEHGPRGGDELNRPEAGKNYGWPVICYCVDYPGGPIGEGITARAGLEQPVYYWDPVIAPGDMTFYRGDLFRGWKGDILVAALSGKLVRLVLRDNKVVGEEWLMRDGGRFRDVLELPDGSLLLSTEADGGQILRLTPEG